MSNDAVNAVRKLDIRPSGRKFVLVALANYADPNWVCYPAVRHLSAFTGQGDKTIRDHLNSLEEGGFIRRSRQRRKNGTVGGYLFTLAKHKILSAPENSPAAEIAPGEINGLPPADFAEQIHHNNTSSLSPLSSTLRADEFDQFWNAYPQKVAYPQARQAFGRALEKASVDVILAGVSRYAAKTDDRPWCNPATWLDQERWTDEPAMLPPKRVGAKPSNKPTNNSLQALSRRLLGGPQNG